MFSEDEKNIAIKQIEFLSGIYWVSNPEKRNLYSFKYKDQKDFKERIFLLDVDKPENSHDSFIPNSKFSCAFLVKKNSEELEKIKEVLVLIKKKYSTFLFPGSQVT